MRVSRATLRPPLRRPQNLEELEQYRVIAWARTIETEHGLLAENMFAIPNGTFLGGSARQRAFQMTRLKRAGLRPGAADLFVSLPRREWHGFYVEMKKQRSDFRGLAEIKRAVSDDQADFGRRVLAAGYMWCAAFGFEEGRDAILAYLGGRDPRLELP